MTIIVIGGGIGGLALAAGLKKNGFEVIVVEKDTDLSVTGGYHITLHKEVQEALTQLLPADTMIKLLASSADGKKREPDVFWDWRGRLFWRMKPFADAGIDIDRITLRILLGEAVGDSVLLGRSCMGYVVENDHILARLDDGTTLKGDILVGCDGTHSTIIKQLVGQPTNYPTGIIGISGRTRVSRLDASLHHKLGKRSSMAMGPGGIALYLGYFDPVHQAVLDRPDLRISLTKEATYIWGAMFPESIELRSLSHKRHTALQLATIELMHKRGWSSTLLDVITHSCVDDIALYRFNAASTTPEALAPWHSDRVVALGDAVHATPPTAGMGAGIAILDANDLVIELNKVRLGETSLPNALRSFQDKMRIRGSKAIEAALAIIKWIKFTNTAVGSRLTRLILPIMASYVKRFGRP